VTEATLIRTVSRVVAIGLLGVAMIGCSSSGDKTTSEGTPPKQTSAPASAPAQAPSPSMIPNPNGDGTMVPCEGTICTNPNHGAGTDPEENGGAEMLSPEGDGSVVPCEGTICTNPNHGAGDDGEDY
jgi:hypothetical protein